MSNRFDKCDLAMDLTDPTQMGMALEGYKIRCVLEKEVVVIDETHQKGWYFGDRDAAVMAYKDHWRGVGWWLLEPWR